RGGGVELGEMGVARRGGQRARHERHTRGMRQRRDGSVNNPRRSVNRSWPNRRVAYADVLLITFRCELGREQRVVPRTARPGSEANAQLFVDGHWSDARW